VAAPGSPRSDTPAPRTTAPLVEERAPRDSEDARRAALSRQLANYQPLLDRLHFTVEQRQTFNELLAVNLRHQADLHEVARTQGTRPVDADIEALRAEADEELSTRIRAAFGPAVQDEFDHFNKTGPMREFVHHLAEALAVTPTPLSPSQSEHLVEILAQHNRRSDGSIVENPREFEVEAAISDPQNPLSSPQNAVLRQLPAQLH
jgi:hypothetical protein